MKKRIIRIARFQAVLLAAAVFVAGCAQIPAEIEKNPASGGEHDRSAALQCGDTALRAFQKKNYELLKEVLVEDLQKKFTSGDVCAIAPGAAEHAGNHPLF
ncbi:MAG: hypothetical protein V8T86_18925 [Victivallis sp.]